MDAVRERADEIGYKLTNESIKIIDGPFKNIRFKFTTLVPEDVIYIHPKLFGKILSYEGSDQIIDIIKEQDSTLEA